MRNRTDPLTARALFRAFLLITLLPTALPAIRAAQFGSVLPEVISAGGDHTIKRWDARGKMASAIGAHDDTITGLAFLANSNGKTLVSVGAEGKLKIWNVPGARPTLVQDAKGNVNALAVSPDGKTIATGGNDNHIRLWNVGDGRELADLPAHTEKINALQFASNEILVSASADKTLRVWNVGRNKGMSLEYKSNIVAHDRPVTALAISPDGKIIASVSEDSFLKTWRIENGGLEHRVRAGDGEIQAVAFSPDGKTIATGDESGKIKLWDAEKVKEIPTFSASHDRAVTALVFSLDGKTLISGSEDRTLRYWNVMNGQQMAKVEAHAGVVRALAIVP